MLLFFAMLACLACPLFWGLETILLSIRVAADLCAMPQPDVFGRCQSRLQQLCVLLEIQTQTELHKCLAQVTLPFIQITFALECAPCL